MATQPNYKGALCEYMTHPEEWTYHVPEGMTTMEAALVEPAAVGMHAAILGEARLGKSIVILGAGTIGLMVLQACKSLGATDITVVDVMDKRLALFTVTSTVCPCPKVTFNAFGCFTFCVV